MSLILAALGSYEVLSRCEPFHKVSCGNYRFFESFPVLLHWWQRWDPFTDPLDRWNRPCGAKHLCELMARRARSLERTGAIEGDALGRLGEIIENLATRRDRQQTFKAPIFDGHGDVELFIERFLEVSEANEWRDAAALLHLKQALQGDAQDYGRARTVLEVVESLRSRFGLTPKEARTCLSKLKRDSKTPLRAHANEVRRLVQLAYRESPRMVQEEMVLETFCQTLDNPYLQRHLLAFNAPTLERAVYAGNEYLQVKAYTKSKTSVRCLEDDEEEDSTPTYVDVIRSQPAKPAQPATANPLEALTKMVQELAEQMAQLKKQPVTSRHKGRGCYGCGKDGHNRSNCPTNSWPKQGNDSGAQE